MQTKTTILLILWSLIGSALLYEVPEPTIVLKELGFEVSIPDEDGIRLFSFHGKKNSKFKGSEAGTMNGDVRAPVNGRWTYINNNIEIGMDDVLYFWIHVQHKRLGYQVYDKQFRLRANSENDIAVTQPECKTTLTKVNGNSVCSGQLIFNEKFHNLSLWKPEIRIPHDNGNAEFVSYQFYPEICNIEKGHLEIRPQLLNESANTNNTVLDLRSSCTASTTEECYREFWSYRILPPIVSSQLSTKNQFTFKYGRVEIRAKLPKGDWIYPDIFIRPSQQSYAAQNQHDKVRLAFIRSNERLLSNDNAEIGGRVLYGGIIEEEGLVKKTTFPTHIGDEYHVFTLEWTDKKAKFKIDGQSYGELNTNDVFKDGEYYLSLGLGVGGVSYFPDFIRTGPHRWPKPWTNDDPKAELNFWKDYANWSESFNGPENVLAVDYIRIYAL